MYLLVTRPMKTSFKIGPDCEVQIYWSQFGLEVYSVNGKEVLRTRSYSIRGSRKFVAIDGERTHDVEIKLDFAPTRKSWISSGDWIAQAYVDGELAVPDLTTQMRGSVRKVERVMNWVFVISLCVLGMLALLSFALR